MTLETPAVYALNRKIRAKQAELDSLDADLSFEEWQDGPLKERRDAVKGELDDLLAQHPAYRRSRVRASVSQVSESLRALIAEAER